MADVPVGAVPAPVASEAKSSPANAAAAAITAKAAKIAAVSAGLAKLNAAETVTPPPVEPAVKPAQQIADEAKAAPKADEKPVEAKPDEPKVEAKTESKDDAPDEKTARGLAALDKQAKRFRDEQASAKAELALERAELARIKADLTSKPAESLDDLRALAKRNPIAALEKLGIESEDDWEVVGRGAFPRTKTGKADPRARDQVNQTAAQREVQSRIDALAKELAETKEQLKTKESAAQVEQFQSRYAADAVKAIPTDPSLIGKLHAKAPEKAKAVLLSLAMHMETEATKADGGKYDSSHTPTHAEVIAQYEKLRRAELEEQGVDVDAMLRPDKITAPTAPAKTLDPAATGGTRPINGNPSRSEKLALASKGLTKLWNETA